MSISTDTTAAAAPSEPELIPLSGPNGFLRRFAVSKSAFWRMAAKGTAPDIVRLGRKNFVELAGARAWVAERVQPAIKLCGRARD